MNYRLLTRTFRGTEYFSSPFIDYRTRLTRPGTYRRRLAATLRHASRRAAPRPGPCLDPAHDTLECIRAAAPLTIDSEGRQHQKCSACGVACYVASASRSELPLQPFCDAPFRLSTNLSAGRRVDMLNATHAEYCNHISQMNSQGMCAWLRAHNIAG